MTIHSGVFASNNTSSITMFAVNTCYAIVREYLNLIMVFFWLMLFHWRDDGSEVCRASGPLHFLQHLDHLEQRFALSAWDFIGSEYIVRESKNGGQHILRCQVQELRHHIHPKLCLLHPFDCAWQLLKVRSCFAEL